MAKHMKETGKRFADKSKISMKKKSIAIALISVLLAMLVIEASLSFFSDIVVAAANAITGNVDITISNVEVEEQDTIPEDDPIVFVSGVPGVLEWTLR